MQEIKELSKEDIITYLENNGYYVQTTSKALGISRGRLLTLMKNFNIPKKVIGKSRAKCKFLNNNTRVNNVYYKMLSRCTDIKNKDYARYGGRGVKVCDRWLESRDYFYEDLKDLPNAFQKGYTLDRIDNDGDYELSNIRFVTMKTQCRNKSNNRIVNFNGEDLCLSELAEKYNLTYDFLKDRLKLGYTLEEAVSSTKWAKRLNENINIIKRGKGKITAIVKLKSLHQTKNFYYDDNSKCKILQEACLWVKNIVDSDGFDFDEFTEKINLKFN